MAQIRNKKWREGYISFDLSALSPPDVREGQDYLNGWVAALQDYLEYDAQP